MSVKSKGKRNETSIRHKIPLIVAVPCGVSCCPIRVNGDCLGMNQKERVSVDGCHWTWPHNFFFVWPYLSRPPSQVVEFFSDIVTTDLSGLFVELGYFILLLALSTARI